MPVERCGVGLCRGSALVEPYPVEGGKGAKGGAEKRTKGGAETGVSFL